MPAMPILQRNAPTPLAPRQPESDAPVLDGLADGLGALAGTAEAYHHADLAQQASAYTLGDAQRAQAFNQATLDLQTKPGRSGGAGYTDDVTQAWEKSYGDVQFASDPQLRRQQQAALATDRARAMMQAASWEHAQNGAASVDNASNASDQLSSNLRNSVPTDLGGALDAYRTTSTKWGSMMGAFVGMDPDNALKVARHGDVGNGDGFIRGLLDKGAYPTAKAALASKEFAHYAPEQLDHWNKRVEVAATGAAQKEKAAIDQARGQAVTALKMEVAQGRQGRPSYDQLTSWAARAQALGMGEEAIALQGDARETAAAEGYRGATMQQRGDRIRALDAKPNLTPDEGRELRGLKGQQSYLQSLSPLDRYGYQTGQAVPSIDWTDPASIRQRIALVQQNGGGDLLKPEEEKQLTDLAQQGTAGKIEAARIAYSTGPYAGQLADRIAGRDQGYRAAILLGQRPDGDRLMEEAIRAPDVLKAHPGLLDLPKGPDGKPIKGPNFDQTYDATMGGADAFLPARQQADMRTNAKALYVANAPQSGFTSYHAGGGVWAASVSAGGRRDGGAWRGGVGRYNGETVILPPDMRETDLSRRLARATDTQWAAASARPNDVPMTGNRRVSAAELAGLRPTMLPDGSYGLRQGNTLIRTKSGGYFTFDPHRLPGTGASSRPIPEPSDLTRDVTGIGTMAASSLPGKL